MMLVEAAFVLGLLGLVLYWTFRLVTPEQGRRSPVSVAGRWVTNHYDRHEATRIVVQKVSLSAGQLLDEHVIAQISVDDPEYDEKFLTAMATARERRALFEAEEA